MSISPTTSKSIVSEGYDKIAQEYLSWTSSKETPRLAYLSQLLSALVQPSSASVLELGCGAGIPVTRLLSERCGSVIGNDISEAQLELAREHCPGRNIKFVHGDMMRLDFQPASFDAVTGFYSIIHLPREEQGEIYRRIFTWLKPGGLLLCNLGVSDNPGSTAEWLGSATEMYWSGYDANVNLAMVKEVGFEIVKTDQIEDLEEDGNHGVEKKAVTFLWILAKKSENGV